MDKIKLVAAMKKIGGYKAILIDKDGAKTQVMMGRWSNRLSVDGHIIKDLPEFDTVRLFDGWYDCHTAEWTAEEVEQHWDGLPKYLRENAKVNGW